MTNILFMASHANSTAFTLSRTLDRSYNTMCIGVVSLSHNLRIRRRCKTATSNSSLYVILYGSTQSTRAFDRRSMTKSCLTQDDRFEFARVWSAPARNCIPALPGGKTRYDECQLKYMAVTLSLSLHTCGTAEAATIDNIVQPAMTIQVQPGVQKTQGRFAGSNQGVIDERKHCCKGWSRF